jgi:hypothetical protein
LALPTADREQAMAAATAPGLLGRLARQHMAEVAR